MTNFQKLANLKGLITPEVGKVLYRLARHVPHEHAIVELGSYHGKSTCYLASGTRDGNQAPVYAVDAWSPRVKAWSRYHNPPSAKQFRRTLKVMGLADTVTPVRGLTTQVARRYQGPPVGMLYVDADHELDAVYADAQAWMPYLHFSAIVVFDDYAGTWNPGVEAAVNLLCADDGPLTWVRLEAERLAMCRPR